MTHVYLVLWFRLCEVLSVVMESIRKVGENVQPLAKTSDLFTRPKWEENRFVFRSPIHLTEAGGKLT